MINKHIPFISYLPSNSGIQISVNTGILSYIHVAHILSHIWWNPHSYIHLFYCTFFSQNAKLEWLVNSTFSVYFESFSSQNFHYS